MKKIFNILGVSFVFLLALVSSCKKEALTLSTTDDVNIAAYLQRYPEKFSMISEIIEKSGTEGILAAYGKYTLFAPTNDAISSWLSKQPKTSINDYTKDELRDLIKVHLIPDTVSTASFTDGKIKQLTYFGQYLQTDVRYSADLGSTYRINKSARVIQQNIRLGNGILHVVDKVLNPATKTLAQLIEDGGRYNIFKQAMIETGFLDSLNAINADTSKRFMTVILETDSALNKAGFADYASLRSKLSNTGNPFNNKADSLWMYVAYHISKGATYSPDIVSTSTIYTIAPNEIITTKLVADTILLNDDEVNGVHEQGVEVDRINSDIPAVNGVIHEVKQFYRIKKRVQTPIYFDVCDQSELRTLPIWRGLIYGDYNLFANGKIVLEGIRTNKIPASNGYGYLTYQYYKSLTTDARRQANDDKISISMSPDPKNARLQWFEMKTPMLVKGKYKVWVCYTAFNTSSPSTQVTFDPGTADEQILPNLVDFRQSLTASGVTTALAGSANADALMLTQGFKRYMATTAETTKTGVKGDIAVSTNNVWDKAVGRLAGTVDVKTTDRHWIRFTVVGGGATDKNVLMDMIHFIPLDADQNYPRYSVSGAVFTRP